jgi:hypothetical protein
MKKLFLTVIIAGTSLIAGNASNDSKYTFDNKASNLALTGATGAVTPLATVGLFMLDEIFGTSLLFSSGTNIFLYAGNVVPIVGAQITTALAAKTIADSIAEHTEDLDRNLVLNVVETAF